ncbi:uncharacterized protein LOC135492574 [Lineus longissimus]|uniref:uncharacterized protein LOC135492574 n=1 Tax=Lineus longissimus TaxID=88925 RepID=UPI00315D2DD5
MANAYSESDSSSICSDCSTSSSALSQFIAADYDSGDDDELFGDVGDPESVPGPIEPYMFEPVPEQVETPVTSMLETEAIIFKHCHPLNTINEEPTYLPVPSPTIYRCHCDNCQIQQKEDECTCCHEIQRVQDKMAEIEAEGTTCIIQHPVCLDHHVLQVAWLQYRQQYGRAAYDGPYEKRMRHISYRQLAKWCWGFLGRDVRVVLPSCAVSRTRAQFMPPVLEEDAEFRGFHHGDSD